MSALPRTFDPVLADLDRHLAAIDRANAEQDHIDELCRRRLATDLEPYKPDNLGEAIGNMPAETLAELGEYLRAGKHAEAGRLLATKVHDYWADAAEVIVRREHVQLDARKDFE